VDEEEAEDLLRALRSSLSEFGSPAVVPPHHGVPEDGEPDVRSELDRIIDEYEAILVDTPEMMKTTMSLLRARSISFTPDASDIRFGDGGARASEMSEVTLSPDDMGEWLTIASEARRVIAELRWRLNDDAH